MQIDAFFLTNPVKPHVSIPQYSNNNINTSDLGFTNMNLKTGATIKYPIQKAARGRKGTKELEEKQRDIFREERVHSIMANSKPFFKLYWRFTKIATS